jgi:hypothetical protein
MVYRVNCREYETKRKLRKNIPTCSHVWRYIIAGYLYKVLLCVYPWWWPFSKANDHGEFLIFTWLKQPTICEMGCWRKAAAESLSATKEIDLLSRQCIMFCGNIILSFRQIPPADYLLPWRSTWDELPIVVVYLDCIPCCTLIDCGHRSNQNSRSEVCLYSYTRGEHNQKPLYTNKNTSIWKRFQQLGLFCISCYTDGFGEISSSALTYLQCTTVSRLESSTNYNPHNFSSGAINKWRVETII